MDWDLLSNGEQIMPTISQNFTLSLFGFEIKTPKSESEIEIIRKTSQKIRQFDGLTEEGFRDAMSEMMKEIEILRENNNSLLTCKEDYCCKKTK